MSAFVRTMLPRSVLDWVVVVSLVGGIVLALEDGAHATIGWVLAFPWWATSQSADAIIDDLTEDVDRLRSLLYPRRVS